MPRAAATSSWRPAASATTSSRSRRATRACPTPRRTPPSAILPDTAREPDETFKVLLSSPVGTTIDDGEGLVTILNDD